MRKAWAAIAGLGLAACSYGPSVDDSGFESAAVSADTKAVVFAYHRLSYRQPTGLAAFPDGGTPQYDRDSIVLAQAPVAGGEIHRIHTFAADGMPGSGHLTIRAYPGDPQHMLVALFDQPSARDLTRVRRWRLDLASWSLEPLPDVEKELAMVGRRLGAREFGDLRLAAGDGSLLLGVSGADGDQLWTRSAEGRLRRIAPLTHFYGVVGDEVYLWSGDEGVVDNWRTGVRRIVARYDPATRTTSTLIRDDPTVNAIQHRDHDPAPVATVSSDRQSISVDSDLVRLDLTNLRR
ncbi:MAG TPA: hypothetical protein VFN88_08775 [Caulobacteraceae bacterium]|nr:hypothetical protein [Caulobacteraceae bacterium]